MLNACYLFPIIEVIIHIIILKLQRTVQEQFLELFPHWKQLKS